MALRSVARSEACFLQRLEVLAEVGEIEHLGLGDLEPLEVLVSRLFGELTRFKVLAAEQLVRVLQACSTMAEADRHPQQLIRLRFKKPVER